MKNQQAKDPALWRLNINTNLNGNEWSISITTNEQGILTILRASYDTFESQLKGLADTPASNRPSGLIYEALKLVRCLVFNKLEPIPGNYINLVRI